MTYWSAMIVPTNYSPVATSAPLGQSSSLTVSQGLTHYPKAELPTEPSGALLESAGRIPAATPPPTLECGPIRGQLSPTAVLSRCGGSENGLALPGRQPRSILKKLPACGSQAAPLGA